VKGGRGGKGWKGRGREMEEPTYKGREGGEKGRGRVPPVITPPRI